MNDKQPKYYITKKIFGMVVQIPVSASEIESLYNQLIGDTTPPAEDPVQLSIFDNPKDVCR